MKSRPYQEIDVFTAQAYRGNPLAVVVDAQGLDTEAMQAFARWTSLSETAFLLPATDPAADYQVRIFTPVRELPFAGHPTLGSCHAWLANGGVPRTPGHVVQQCGVGLVPLRQAEGRLAFRAPALREEAPAPQELAAAYAALRLDASRVRAARWLTNGPRWLSLLLDSATAVLALEPDHAAVARLGLVGVAGLHPAAERPLQGDLEVRAFTAAVNVMEDPVTGSLNAAFAQWLIPTGQLPARYQAAQGQRLQRAGRVHIEAHGAGTPDFTVWVGGDCVSCVEGQVQL